MPTPIKVGVLRGGLGHEYEVSLKTGASVIKNLSPDKYQPVDILITRDGVWHILGRPIAPEEAVRQVDVVFNALHGEFGEDGQLQNLLDLSRVPYTGSGALASALGMNKPKAKEIFRQAGFKVPQDIVLRRELHQDAEEAAYQVFRRLSPPWIIKPSASGSSVGLYLARNYQELVSSLEKVFRLTDDVLVEEYIKGREATCGVVDNFRNQDCHALLPIEIVTAENKQLFDYEAKYSGVTKEICPGRFSQEEKREVERLATEIHKVLGLRHYSRSDFVVSPKGVYVLEVNTLPGLTEESLIPKALKAGGVEYSQFLDHVITLALTNFK